MFCEFDVRSQTENKDILTFVDIQDLLYNIDDEKISLIIHKTKELDKKYFEVLFIHINNALLSHISHTNTYINLIIKLFTDLDHDLIEISLYYFDPWVIRELYLSGCYTLDQIKPMIPVIRDLEKYFVPELNLTKLPRPTKFTDRKGNIEKKYIENNYELYKEQLKYRNNNKIFIDSINQNDLEGFSNVVTRDGYVFTNELALAALYGNNEFFEFILKHRTITEQVIENAYKGGNNSIIKHCKIQDKSKYINFAIEGHNHSLISDMIKDGIEWTLNDGVISLDYKLILYAISLNKKDTFESDEYKRTVLHRAAYKGDFLIGEFLISKGFSINAVDADKRSVAYEAASSNKSSFLKMLIEHGADLTIKNIDGLSALDRAKESKDRKTRALAVNLILNVD